VISGRDSSVSFEAVPTIQARQFSLSKKPPPPPLQKSVLQADLLHWRIGYRSDFLLCRGSYPFVCMPLGSWPCSSVVAREKRLPHIPARSIVFFPRPPVSARQSDVVSRRRQFFPGETEFNFARTLPDRNLLYVTK